MASASAATPSASASILGLGCRLPVVTSDSTAQTYSPSGGFVTFPNGTLSADPNGTFVLAGSGYRTTVQPYLQGGAPGSYDWPIGRWLPTNLRSVSPDGSHYAYHAEFGAIHDVDIATGKDRSLKGPDGPDTVMYYANEGIYFNHAYEAPGPGPGLWLLNPSTGVVRTVFTDKAVETVGGFAAWLPDVNPADPHPVFSPIGGANLPNQLLRRDLNGGPTSVWFYRPGHSLWVVGFDQGKQPLIAVESGSSPETVEIWQVPAANQGTKLYSGAGGAGLPWVMADAHGVWFADQHGIWLYTASRGLQKVSPVIGQLAGACR
jgi:hypothetical protein